MPLLDLKFEQTLNKSVLDDSLECEDKENVTFRKPYLEVQKPISFSIEFTPENRRQSRKAREQIRKSLSTTVTLRRSVGGRSNESYTVEKPLQVTPAKPKSAVKKPKTPKSTCLRRSQRRTFERVNVMVLSQTIQDIKSINARLESHLSTSALFRRVYLDLEKHRTDLITNQFISSALAIQRWWRRWRETRSERAFLRQHLNKLRQIETEKSKENAALVIQKAWRQNKAIRLLKKKVSECALTARRTRFVQTGRFASNLNDNCHVDKENAPLAGHELESRLMRSKMEAQFKKLSFWLADIQAFNGSNSNSMQITIRNDLKKQNAAILIQSHVKGWLARRAHQKQIERRITAAIVLQKHWRSRAARMQLKQLRQAKKELSAVVRLQTFVRVQLARRKLNELREHHQRKQIAATTIQKYWRAKQARCLVNQMKYDLQVRSALIVQNFWRRCKAQRTFQRMQQEQQIRWTQSAIIIQSNWRCFLARKQLKQIRQQRFVLLQQTSAIKIQRFWRQWKARQIVKQLMEEIEMEKSAAIVIQKQWRAYQARKNKSAIIIQKHWRGRMARKATETLWKQKQAAIRIQRQWRVHQNRVHFASAMHRYKSAVVLLQSNWRRVQAERQLNRLRIEQKAAVKIQRWFRCYLASRKFKRQMQIYRKSATLLQNFWRQNRLRVQQKRVEATKVAAAIKIQSCWRMFVSRRNYLDQLEEKRLQMSAAILIQRFWRKRQARLNKTSSSSLATTKSNKTANRSFTVGVDQSYLSNFWSHSLIRRLRLFQRSMSLKYTKRTAEMLDTLIEKTSVNSVSCHLYACKEITTLLLLILRNCNRSDPHCRIASAICSVLLNITLDNQSRLRLTPNANFKNLILHSILRYQKNQSILLKCLTIMYIVMKDNNFEDHPKFLYRLKKVIGRFNCRSLRRMSRSKSYEFKPLWHQEKGARHQFTSCNQAINAFNEML